MNTTPTQTPTINRRFFELGKLLATPGGLLKLHPEDRAQGLIRHGNCDWGDYGPGDWEQNDLAVDELLLPATLKPLSQLMAPPPEPEVPDGDGAPADGDTPNTGVNTGVDSGKAPDDDKTERAETSVEVARGYDYSCVMVMLAPQAADRVRKFARELISADDLTEKGFDDEPHITLLYGLHTADATDVGDVLCPWSNFRVCVKGISVFSTDKYDVVKLDVDGHDGDLSSINARLRELDYTSDHDEFKPHLTLAYVKPGEGAKYVGKAFPFWEGGTDEAGWLKFDSVRFSSKDGTQRDINLRSGHEKAVERALGQWERKSLKRLERGQGAACAFESEVLSDEMRDNLRELLETVCDKGGVREVMRMAGRAKTTGDPHNNSGSFASFWSGPDRDEVTKKLFNGKLEVTGFDAPQVLEASEKLFGRKFSAEDWKELSGAPDKHNLRVKAVEDSIELKIDKGPNESDAFFQKAVISKVHPSHVRPYATSRGVLLELESMYKNTADDSKAPKDLAPRMLAHIFKKCDLIGIDNVFANAAGHSGKPGGDIGFWRWPQLGFDAPLTPEDIAILPPDLQGSTRISDVIQKGRLDWWQAKGHGDEMEFDLTRGSRSRKIFEAYLADKKISI